MTTEMPMEEATLRIRVSIEVPSVRRWLGSVRNATVLSGTNTRPKPNPCAIETTTISGTPVGSVRAVNKDRERPVRPETAGDQRARLDIAHQASDQHHGDKSAAAARCQ